MAVDISFDLEWGSTGSANGEFASPKQVSFDTSGNVYVADAGNNRIQKFDSVGNHLLSWGTAGTGDGEFDLPEGIHVDSSNNVYVADTQNDRIQR